MAAKKTRVLYQATADAIRAQIASGDLKPGSRAGASLGAMARQHHVGIATVRAALAILGEEGLVETIPGKGTFVLAAPASGTPGTGGDVAALRDDLGRVEAALIELYGKTGHDYPAHKQSRRKDPREERDERAG